jgi:hypothetical protein
MLHHLKDALANLYRGLARLALGDALGDTPNFCRGQRRGATRLVDLG